MTRLRTPTEPMRDPDFRPDAAALMRWNAAIERSRAAYADRDRQLAHAQLAHERRLASQEAKK